MANVNVDDKWVLMGVLRLSVCACVCMFMCFWVFSLIPVVCFYFLFFWIRFSPVFASIFIEHLRIFCVTWVLVYRKCITHMYISVSLPIIFKSSYFVYIYMNIILETNRYTDFRWMYYTQMFSIFYKFKRTLLLACDFIWLKIENSKNERPKCKMNWKRTT